MNRRLLNHIVRFSLCAGLAFVPFAADAIRAKQGPITVTQPDGTTLTIRLEGDERHHSVFTVDGYLLSVDADGFYNFASLDKDNNIVSSGVRAVDASYRDASVKKFLSGLNTPEMYKVLQNQADRKVEEALSMQREGLKKGPGLCDTSFPSYGEQKALVILVEYSDVKFDLENPSDYFTRLLNEKGFCDYKSTGSARDFFIYNSMGAFSPEFDVVGPVELPNRMAYYGGNDAWGNDRHPEEMVIDACNILDETLDFSQYDRDGDGFIDNIYLFYAGFGEADGGSANTVWPHSWDVAYGKPDQKYIYDGVQLNHYACSNETDFQTRRPDGIGTFVHEFSHVMGLPDLYSTRYNPGCHTPGPWSTLDYGPYNNEGRTPPNYSAYERYALGWMEPEEISAYTKEEITLEPVDVSNRALIVRVPDNDDEWFLFENRQQDNWDTYIPGHGMLVWHIDYVASVWASNTVNNTPSHQHVDIIEADNHKSDTSYAGDTFPGSKNITEFNDGTKPAFKPWNRKNLGISIENIEETEDGLIKFNVVGNKANDSVDGIGANGWRIESRTLFAGDDIVEVYSVDGNKAASLNSGERVVLPAGLYVVRSAGKSVKVML